MAEVSAAAEVPPEAAVSAVAAASEVAEVSLTSYPTSYFNSALGGFDQGPPEYVEQVAEFSHACEGMLICFNSTDNVPLLMRNIYL